MEWGRPRRRPRSPARWALSRGGVGGPPGDAPGADAAHLGPSHRERAGQFPSRRPGQVA